MDRIGDVLLSSNMLNAQHINTIINSQKNSNDLFGEIAVKLGFLKEENLLPILSERYNVPIADIEFMYIDQNTLFSIDYEIAEKTQAVPFSISNEHVKIAIADPGNLQFVDLITDYFLPKRVKFFIAKKSEIQKLIEILKCKTCNFDNNPIMLLNKIIFEAVEKKCSDIHFEPCENYVNIRIRVDGVLQVLQTISSVAWDRIQARLKLISHLNITENRRPQSGHCRIQLGGKSIDLRISTHPGIYGESFVVRLFDLTNGIKNLNDLNFQKDDFLWLQKILRHPQGIFLIVAPTGSGKTTTLYSLLKEINTTTRNIMTLEDPVEYIIPGIRQLDLREEGILSFSDGVRSILRQDPDVLLIGEIRDEKTAASALRASLTGRLVLSTLHASTPLEALRRLMDLKLSLSDFVPSLIGIFSQRLVRYKIGNTYIGRFPITEYIYFPQEVKENILKTNDISQCKLDKSFIESAKFAISKNMTDGCEIKRMLGDVDL